ncbi:hypothetical protein ACWEV3_39710 [Saccharopolyspora sp. NPDC003752]
MPHYHDQRHAQVLDGVLDVTDDGTVEHLPVRYESRKAAKSLVEDTAAVDAPDRRNRFRRENDDLVSCTEP